MLFEEIYTEFPCEDKFSKSISVELDSLEPSSIFCLSELLSLFSLSFISCFCTSSITLFKSSEELFAFVVSVFS